MRPTLLPLVTVIACGLVSAEEGPREPHAPVAVEAPPTPVDGTPHTVRQGGPRGPSRKARPDPKLGGVRAIETREGEATLVLAGGQRTVRPGDVVSGDTVKVVEPGRVVLTRPDPMGGPAAIVIVRFDGSGRGRVTVYSVRDTSPAAPPRPAGE